jgi:hypothetical protein
MDNNSLYHHGVKGQRWGVRRYQKQDGTLTPAGKKRYAKNTKREKPKEKPKELTPEEKKAKVVKDRSAKTFYDNRKMFTYDETKAMRQLLQEDELIKKMIVEEPNKVKKFLDNAGDFAGTIKNIVVPVVDTLKKLNELGGGNDQKSTNNSKSNSGNENKKNAKSNSGNENKKNAKPSNQDPEVFDPDEVTDAPDTSSSSDAKRKKNTSNNIYDTPFTDIGNDSSDVYNIVNTVFRTGSSVMDFMGSFVDSSVPPSPSTTSFVNDNIAGYLPEHKKED